MNPRKPRILYVDDDPHQLSAFKAAFRRNYDIFIAHSASKGKEELKKQAIDIIITDQRMPDMTGVEFLESIVEEYPDLIKILMTGYTDLKEAASAINKGKIYCYLNKPWDEVELTMILKNAYDICCARRELKEKHDELQKTNSELEKFVYSASHDLRAPVLSIKGVINFAMSQTKPKDQEYLLMIEKSINRLDVFVENIINYHQNAKLRVDPVEIRFDKMIEETWSSFNFIQNKSEIDFRCNINQEDVFKTDEFRVQVILNNLLLNAIKYQGQNNVSRLISVDILVANNIATISVSDTGIGIETEHLDKIFNMFYRATQEKPGSGLGLYIVREAVDKIGGAIAVRSVAGKGSTFTVTIPGKG